MTRKPFAEFERSKDVWVPREDTRVEAFKARRAIIATQIRYWARLGHELPKPRKFAVEKMPCT